MDRWILCGHDMEEKFSSGLLKARNCPSVNHASYFARQGQRASNTKKISLKEKKPLMNVEQKMYPSQQRQSVVSLEKRIQGGLFQNNSLRNLHLENCCKKIIFEKAVPQLQEQKRMDLNLGNVQKWTLGLAEVKENKRVLFSQKITINYINSNNHIPSNPQIYWTQKKDHSKEIEASTQPRSSTIKTSGFDLEQKMSSTFILSNNRLLTKKNSSEIIAKPSTEQSCLKQTKNLDQMQFCRKAQSLADSEEFEEQFSLVIDKLEDYGMQESLMKEPSTPDTVTSEFFGFGV